MASNGPSGGIQKASLLQFHAGYPTEQDVEAGNGDTLF